MGSLTAQAHVGWVPGAPGAADCPQVEPAEPRSPHLIIYTCYNPGDVSGGGLKEIKRFLRVKHWIVTEEGEV